MTDRKRTRRDHIDPALYEPIGRVAVEFGILEDHLQWAIDALFLGSPDRKSIRILVGPLRFAEKVRIYEELYQYLRPKADPAQIKNLCKRLRETAEERNKTLHGVWGLLDTEVEAIFRRLARQLGYHVRATFGFVKEEEEKKEKQKEKEEQKEKEAAALRISRGSKRGSAQRRKVTRSELEELATEIGELGDELFRFSMLTASRMKAVGVPEDEK
jgi:hypothetical protein